MNTTLVHDCATLAPHDHLNAVYTTFSALFEGPFHSMLWRLMIDLDSSARYRAAAFVVVTSGPRYEIGIADLGIAGYTPTGVYVRVGDYDEACGLADVLNRHVFGVEPLEAMSIVATTMRKRTPIKWGAR